MHSISDIVQRVIFEVSHVIAFNVGFKFDTRIYENFEQFDNSVRSCDR